MTTRTARIDVHLTPDDARAALRADVLLGLASRPRKLPPKYFYDARGSALFEEITALPEYFPTRTEAALLAAHVDDIGPDRGDDAGRARIGSSPDRLLLDALTRRHAAPLVPLDVSAARCASARRARVGYPSRAGTGVGDFTAPGPPARDIGR